MEKVLMVRLPDGYVMKSMEQAVDGSGRICFANEEGALLQVSIVYSEGMIDFDTEDAEVATMKIYDWPAIYVAKKVIV